MHWHSVRMLILDRCRHSCICFILRKKLIHDKDIHTECLKYPIVHISCFPIYYVSFFVKFNYCHYKWRLFWLNTINTLYILYTFSVHSLYNEFITVLMLGFGAFFKVYLFILRENENPKQAPHRQHRAWPWCSNSQTVKLWPEPKPRARCSADWATHPGAPDLEHF